MLSNMPAAEKNRTLHNYKHPLPEHVADPVSMNPVLQGHEPVVPHVQARLLTAQLGPFRVAGQSAQPEVAVVMHM